MSDTDDKRVRELAYRYYIGELSYESYRSERTRLIDSLTQQAGDDTSLSSTQAMSDETRVMPGSSLRRHRSIWILVVFILAIIFLVWLLKSGWITMSLPQMEHGAAEPSVAGPDRTANIDTEDYKYLNG